MVTIIDAHFRNGSALGDRTLAEGGEPREAAPARRASQRRPAKRRSHVSSRCSRRKFNGAHRRGGRNWGV